MSDPKFVALAHTNDLYEIVLMDEEKQRVGHGYRGPTHSRAAQDLKYWTRTKGLIEIEVPAE
ncbi:MAG TPA: hypothetical protein VG815_00435 [Chloroflexota bacterium]|nr:hypothetical protein [Chloroflexota bacterium]